MMMKSWWWRDESKDSSDEEVEADNVENEDKDNLVWCERT